MRALWTIGFLLAGLTGAQAQRADLFVNGAAVSPSNPVPSTGSTSSGTVTPGTTPSAVQSVQGGGAGALPVGIRVTSVTYAAPTTATIATANTAITVFTAGQVATGCDFVNLLSVVLYLDFTTTAVAGASTALPLVPGQSFHCPYPPTGAVSAVASATGSFVAVRY
jgi:hypothetical protein